MRHIKGFSLLGTVIALSLITIGGIFAIQYQLRQAKAQIAQTWIETQAREMDQVVAAVRTWTNVPANVASWTNDTRTGIACSSLTTAGALPTAFGRDSAIWLRLTHGRTGSTDLARHRQGARHRRQVQSSPKGEG